MSSQRGLPSIQLSVEAEHIIQELKNEQEASADKDITNAGRIVDSEISGFRLCLGGIEGSTPVLDSGYDSVVSTDRRLSWKGRHNELIPLPSSVHESSGRNTDRTKHAAGKSCDRKYRLQQTSATVTNRETFASLRGDTTKRVNQLQPLVHHGQQQEQEQGQQQQQQQQQGQQPNPKWHELQQQPQPQVNRINPVNPFRLTPAGYDARFEEWQQSVDNCYDDLEGAMMSEIRAKAVEKCKRWLKKYCS